MRPIDDEPWQITDATAMTVRFKIDVIYFKFQSDSHQRFCRVVVITPDFDYKDLSGNPGSNPGKTFFFFAFCTLSPG
jgi:hypothetical protein